MQNCADQQPQILAASLIKVPISATEQTPRESKYSDVTLVFLHGLLGDQNDWQGVLPQLSKQFRCLVIDLPFHGKSQNIHVDGFEESTQYLINTLNHYLSENDRFCLVGYSLGGRLAMHLADETQKTKIQAHWAGLIVESGHIGLAESERAARYQNDETWAIRFESEPIKTVLQSWYQQPVFSTLTASQRDQLVERRSQNQGADIAQMLRATSLAKQDNKLQTLQAAEFPVHFICGKKDRTFVKMIEATNLNYHLVEGSGHNIHLEQADLFVAQIIKIISKEIECH